MILLRCNSSLENNGSFKVIYVFKLGGCFQALSWYHPNNTGKLITVLWTTCASVSFFNTQAVNEKITEAA